MKEKDGSSAVNAYDLQDEVDSKNASIDALATKGLKLQDVPIEGGTLSAEYGKLVDETNGNPSNKQIRKWAKKKHPTERVSYSNLIKASGGSTKMGVRTKH